MSRPITRYLTLRWLAIMMAAVEVGIHAVLVPVHLKETPYIGVLFIVASVLLTAVLISLLIGRVRPVGWLVGAAACAGDVRRIPAQPDDRASRLPRAMDK